MGLASAAFLIGVAWPVNGAIELRVQLRENPMLNGSVALENILAAMEQDGLLNQN